METELQKLNRRLGYVEAACGRLEWSVWWIWTVLILTGMAGFLLGIITGNL